MAREKNTTRSEARRRTRVAVRDMQSAETDESSDEAMPVADDGVTAQRSSLFRIPNVRADIESVPDMFRTRRLLWLPFVLLLGSFPVALGVPFSSLDPGIAGLLNLYFQMAFVPSGLIVYLLAGFLAPRAPYLVGFLLGVLNSVLLAAVVAIKTDAVLASGTDPSQAQVGLALVVGYALVVGPLAAAFAAWYRSFLNRMGSQGRERRIAKDAELAKKRKEEARAAKRPART